MEQHELRICIQFREILVRRSAIEQFLAYNSFLI